MRSLLAALLLLLSPPVQAGDVRVAVASNFVPAMEALARAFKAESGHQVEIMAGSSGAIYAQIRQGAPFDLFLSADDARPIQIVAAKLASPEDRATYALGALALWSRKDVSLPDQKAVTAYLSNLKPRQLAMANPVTAPYGLAAQEVLDALGIAQATPVMGQNVGQTFALVASGNVEAGFVASSQLRSVSLGTIWPVPEDLYVPIRQDMVLLARASRNTAAAALFAWLQSEAARSKIAKAGYRLPEKP